MFPSAIVLELFVDKCSCPICLLQNSEQGIKVNFLHQGLLSFDGISYFFTDSTEPYRPIKYTILHLVVIFTHVDHVEFVVYASDFDRFGRVSSFLISQID